MNRHSSLCWVVWAAAQDARGLPQTVRHERQTEELSKGMQRRYVGTKAELDALLDRSQAWIDAWQQYNVRT